MMRTYQIFDEITKRDVMPERTGFIKWFRFEIKIKIRFCSGSGPQKIKIIGYGSVTVRAKQLKTGL